MNELGLSARWRSWAPHLLSVLRIVAAFLFIQFGTAKLIAFPGAIMPGGGTVRVLSPFGLAGMLEALGGLLLLVGLFTRVVAFVLSGEMAVAYFYGHAPHGFWTVLNQGTPAVMFCFLFLYPRLPVGDPGVWTRSSAPGSRPAPVDDAADAISGTSRCRARFNA